MFIFKLPPSDSCIGKAGLHRCTTAIISRATHEVRDRPLLTLPAPPIRALNMGPTQRLKACAALRLLIPSIRIVSRKPVVAFQSNPGRDNVVRSPEPPTFRNAIKGINKYLLRKRYGKIVQFAHFGFPYQRYATTFKRFLLRTQMNSEVKQCIWQQLNRSFVEIILGNDLAAIASPAI